jgi:hypothetical protein
LGVHEKLQGLTVNITCGFISEATARNHECKQHFQIRSLNTSSSSMPETIASTHEYEEQFYIKGKADNNEYEYTW